MNGSGSVHDDNESNSDVAALLVAMQGVCQQNDMLAVEKSIDELLVESTTYSKCVQMIQ